MDNDRRFPPLSGRPPLSDKRLSKKPSSSRPEFEANSSSSIASRSFQFRRESPLSNLDPRNIPIEPNFVPSDSGTQHAEETNRQEEWEILKRWAATSVVAYATYATFLLTLLQDSNSGSQLILDNRDYERHVLLERLTNLRDEDCREQLRMGKVAFANLVYILRQRGLLIDTVHSRVEERVAMFLHTLAYDVRNRTMKFHFRRSGETTSRHFHQVLKAIISLEDLFLRQPNGEEYALEIRNNPKNWPYFKDCVGAIDGSHFRVKVPHDEVQRYRGRKFYPTQNVLAACTFDMRFTYVLPGWEGSASDSRILNDALTREIDCLIVPRGKYYLADAGYQLKTGFLTPFRSTRYHLNEYSNCPPETPEEIFNLRHSSLRNTIERSFGVLKKRFAILGSGAEPYFQVDTQGDIVVACCILHNYLMGVDPFENLLEDVDRELLRQPMDDIPSMSSLADECREGEQLREEIARDMWRDYIRTRRRRFNCS